MFFKVLGIAFLAVVCFGILKSVKPELSTFVPIVTGAIVILLLSDDVLTSVEAFRSIAEKTGLTQPLFSSLIKIVGIGYLTEYGVEICEDAGCSSIGKKVEFAGKITIFVSALPIVTNIIDLIGTLF